MNALSWYVCVQQVKYDELLQRCKQASDELNHKAVQTSSSPFPSNRARRRLSSSAALSNLTVVLEDGQQPEYKTLFKEIFTCIQKTKEGLSENKQPVRNSDSWGSAKWLYFSSLWDFLTLGKLRLLWDRNTERVQMQSAHSVPLRLRHVAILLSPVKLMHLCFCQSALFLFILSLSKCIFKLVKLSSYIIWSENRNSKINNNYSKGYIW